MLEVIIEFLKQVRNSIIIIFIKKIIFLNVYFYFTSLFKINCNTILYFYFSLANIFLLRPFKKQLNLIATTSLESKNVIIKVPDIIIINLIISLDIKEHITNTAPIK